MRGSKSRFWVAPRGSGMSSSPLDIGIHGSPVPDRQNPDLVGAHPVYDTVVADPKLPISFQRTAKRDAESLWSFGGTVLDSVGDAGPDVARDPGKVVPRHLRVIEEAKHRLTSLGLPHLRVRERASSGK